VSEPIAPRPEWNRGGGDHDKPFRFGRHPLTYLTAREFARLMLRFPKPELLEPIVE
jgi:hypothetical protein